MKKMNTVVLPLLVLGGVAVGAAAYLYTKKKGTPADRLLRSSSKLKLNISQMEGALTMKEVVAWFQNLQLSQEQHTPFLARTSAVQSFCQLPDCDNDKSLFLGVYDEKADTLVHHRLVIATELSDDLLKVLGEEPYVVLQ